MNALDTQFVPSSAVVIDTLIILDHMQCIDLIIIYCLSMNFLQLLTAPNGIHRLILKA